MKVVVDRQYGEVLGAQILGPDATELIGQAALAIKADLRRRVARSNVNVHPTLTVAFSRSP